MSYIRAEQNLLLTVVSEGIYYSIVSNLSLQLQISGLNNFATSVSAILNIVALVTSELYSSIHFTGRKKATKSVIDQ